MRQKLVTELVQAALTTRGATSVEVRRAVHDRVRRLALENTGSGTGKGASSELDGVLLSEQMKAYVDCVAGRAHEVTTAQVHALRDAGLSDEAIYELTVVAAVASGTLQLERGLAALEVLR